MSMNSKSESERKRNKKMAGQSRRSVSRNEKQQVGSVDRERKTSRKGVKREKVIKCAGVSYITCVSIVHTRLIYSTCRLSGKQEPPSAHRSPVLIGNVRCVMSCHADLISHKSRRQRACVTQMGPHHLLSFQSLPGPRSKDSFAIKGPEAWISKFQESQFNCGEWLKRENK